MNIMGMFCTSILIGVFLPGDPTMLSWWATMITAAIANVAFWSKGE